MSKRLMIRLNRVIDVEEDDVPMYESNGYKEYDPETGEAIDPDANKSDKGGDGNDGKPLTQGAIRALNTAALQELADQHGVDISGESNNSGRADKIWAHLEAQKGS